jgi:signal transduction histidine kinase
MLDFLLNLFSEDGFLPHGHCFLWTPGVLWTDVISDLLITLSYYSIPVCVLYFLKQRKDVPFARLPILFSLFVFACGTTHLMSVVDIWTPLYRLDALFRAITAAVSVVTAVFMWSLLPALLAHPSRADLEASNEKLRKEVETRTRLEREMLELNHTLEYRVRQRTAQLEKLNQELRQESSERRRAEEQTRSLNINLETRVADRTAQLRLANQELEAFSYSVAHDLWAPLRAIDGFSQALLEDYSSQIPEAGKRFIGRIRAATARMGVLIDSMLELSRLTRTDMNRKRVDLSEIARAVLDNLAHDQPRTDMTIQIEPGQFALADPKYLGIVMENLLGNAWKYTSKTPQAHIEFGRLTDVDVKDPTWFVRDNGAGFDMAYAEKLFGVFQRFHTESEFPGNGVGLATVRRILVKHGGRIWAQAEPGLGATFFFTLGSPPLEDPAALATTQSLEETKDAAP